MSDLYIRGALVKYWPGARHESIPGKYAHLISDGVVEFGGTDCVRIQKGDGGTDYIALTHVEVVA
jgi:hypothetical protein